MGISVLVIVFFYFGEKLVNEQDYQAKVSQLENQSNIANRVQFPKGYGRGYPRSGR